LLDETVVPVSASGPFGVLLLLLLFERPHIVDSLQVVHDVGTADQIHAATEVVAVHVRHLIPPLAGREFGHVDVGVDERSFGVFTLLDHVVGVGLATAESVLGVTDDVAFVASTEAGVEATSRVSDHVRSESGISVTADRPLRASTGGILATHRFSVQGSELVNIEQGVVIAVPVFTTLITHTHASVVARFSDTGVDVRVVN
jgi:hypothetical protein